MEIIIRKKKPAPIRPSAHTSALMAATPKRGVNNSLEWEVTNNATLTGQEIEALKRRHKSAAPNLQRATEVKRLIGEGKRCKDILMLLGRKYGTTMLKVDHATLSRGGGGAKKGAKKVQ